MTRALAAVVAALLVLAGVQQCRAVSLARELTAAQLAPTVRAVSLAQSRVETVTVRLAGAVARVVAVERVRVDTLMLAPATRAETLTALVQLPALATVHEKLENSCTALVLSCDEFRTAAESRDSAQRIRVRALESALTDARPSRVGAIWNRTKFPLAFVAGLAVGARVLH